MKPILGPCSALLAVLAVVAAAGCSTRAASPGAAIESPLAVTPATPAASASAEVESPSAVTSATTAAPDDPRYEAAVVEVAPLAAGRSISCYDAQVPVGKLAMPGQAEKGSSPAARALRAFLAHNPWDSMYPVTNHGWMLIAENSRTYVFGQRTGKVGMGAVVTLVNKGGQYLPDQLGGCGAVIPGPGEESAGIQAVTVSGRSLKINWSNGSCGAGAPPDRVLIRVETVQTSTSVHLLVVTKPNPAVAASMTNTADTGKTASTGCGGVGLSSKAAMTLGAPLGKRKLFNDAHVPAEAITVG